jgi:hypothetical protein
MWSRAKNANLKAQKLIGSVMDRNGKLRRRGEIIIG